MNIVVLKEVLNRMKENLNKKSIVGGEFIYGLVVVENDPFHAVNIQKLLDDIPGGILESIDETDYCIDEAYETQKDGIKAELLLFSGVRDVLCDNLLMSVATHTHMSSDNFLFSIHNEEINYMTDIDMTFNNFKRSESELLSFVYHFEPQRFAEGVLSVFHVYSTVESLLRTGDVK